LERHDDRTRGGDRGGVADQANGMEAHRRRTRRRVARRDGRSPAVAGQAAGVRRVVPAPFHDTGSRREGVAPMPESATAPHAGLLTQQGAPVPLTGVDVSAELSNLVARVTVTQRFVNLETTPIEAVYVFPLDEGAAVCGFEALIDGTLVVGEVREREAAF